MSDPFDEAFKNSEWLNLSPAQRDCLVSAVAAADDENRVRPYKVGFPANVAQSKALNAYILYEDYCWRITEDAKLLVTHAKAHFVFPAWRYLRQWNGEGVVSILQTQDKALADQLLQQDGWKEINKEYFQGMARNLSRVHNGQRVQSIKPTF